MVMPTKTVTKPKRGRPAAGTEDAVAVAYMERQVVDMRIAGASFPAIDAELGITNSDRIFRRAAPRLREANREDAYALESARLDALHAKAWQALEADGLDSLSHRVAEILRDGEDAMEWEGIPERVRAVIERAYADTYKGIPVALGVHDRRAKLDGLTHSDRIADAQLSLDQAKVQIMAGALVEALGAVELTADQKRAVIVRWGEVVAAANGEDA